MAVNPQIDSEALFAALGPEDPDLLALARQPQLLPRHAVTVLALTRGEAPTAASRISRLSRTAAQRLRGILAVTGAGRRACVVYGLSLDETNLTPALRDPHLRIQYGNAANALVKNFLASGDVPASLAGRESGWIFDIPGSKAWPQNLEGRADLNVVLSHFLEEAGIDNPEELKSRIDRGIVQLGNFPLPVFQVLHFTLAAREIAFNRFKIQHNDSQTWLPSHTQMVITANEIKQSIGGKWPQIHNLSESGRARLSEAARTRRNAPGYQEKLNQGARKKLEDPVFKQKRTELSRSAARKMLTSEGMVDRRTETRMQNWRSTPDYQDAAGLLDANLNINAIARNLTATNGKSFSANKSFVSRVANDRKRQSGLKTPEC